MIVLAAIAILGSRGAAMQTRDALIRLDRTGAIASIVSRKTGKEYCASGQSSPLLCLSEHGHLILPSSAAFKGKEIDLVYPNGAKVKVLVSQEDRYLRFRLASIENRGNVDDVVWGPIRTNISKTIGDLLGVVRDGEWAIGMLGLDDNTIAGLPTDGEFAPMEYFVHSPDPGRFPIDPKFKEGQRFNIGGDGVNDVAFYSHPEEYFQMVFGNAATLEPGFGSMLAYHSRDRRKSYTHRLSLLPGFQGSRPRHQVTDPLPGVDFVGSEVALYACPDKDGLSVIQGIIRKEGLPHVENGGKWVRDPSGFKPDIAWYGPHDKLIEYADALGLKAVQDEGQGEYYANPADHWLGPRVHFADGRGLSYKEFTAEAGKHGIKYGLHTLCLFLQPGGCVDVSPSANPRLQTVLRTKLAKYLAASDTGIVVTDPSYLAEDGTWPMRDGSNTLRIGTELVHYGRISATAPWTLKGVQRGFAGTKAQVHRAGDEVSKLQMNCYNGFAPDMSLMLDYADYYAAVLAENGMEYIDFDGLESTLYQGHGYYTVRVFFRRLFDRYRKLSGGKELRVMGSCVFPGAWEYMGVCNIGGDANMFDPVQNRWGIEGKDVRNGFHNSYFAATFGIQSYRSDWTEYDAENLQAKSIGWNATYMLGLSQQAVEASGDKEAIFRSFRTWEDARALGLFSDAIKERLKDLRLKFHLERKGARQFELTPVTETRLKADSSPGEKEIEVRNEGKAQPLEFALRVGAPASRCTVTSPEGVLIDDAIRLESGQFVVVKGEKAYVADKFRKPLRDIHLLRPALLRPGQSKFGLRLENSSPSNGVPFEWTIWVHGKQTLLLSSKS